MSNQPPYGYPPLPGYGPPPQGNWPPGYGHPPQQPPPPPKPGRSTGEIVAIVFGLLIGSTITCGTVVAVLKPEQSDSSPSTTSPADDDPAVGQNAYAYSKDEHGAIDVFPTIEMARVGDDHSPEGTLARQSRKRIVEGCKVRRIGGNGRFPEVEIMEGPWQGRHMFGFWLYFHTKQKPGITSPVY